MTFQSRLAGSFRPASVSPPPTNAETLRHMVECIPADDGDSIMWRYALISAAVELDELHVRIRQLEDRTAQAAELVSKAVGIMAPPA